MIPDSVVDEAFNEILDVESRIQKAKNDGYWQGRRDERALQKTLQDNKPSCWAVNYVNIT